jgi:hypothetical protein
MGSWLLLGVDSLIACIAVGIAIARVDIKAPRGATRAADTASTAALPPAWPLAPVG